MYTEYYAGCSSKCSENDKYSFYCNYSNCNNDLSYFTTLTPRSTKPSKFCLYIE